eukprot:TRINITY_DN8012_c0_g1_i1.p1 TRINITY_DN8012_c0_g1~~TRINITY_DN8012_c0_g1_i1.p1  ORF type:complete len:112 (+),score=17.78 TRINITY_DN8012_c0_g1_i1:2-337(+)
MSLTREIEITDDIIIKINQIFDGELGKTVWDSALSFVYYIIKQSPKIFEKKKILELGCGTGISSITISKLFGNKVIMTDKIDEIVDLAKKKCEIKQCGLCCTIAWLGRKEY